MPTVHTLSPLWPLLLGWLLGLFTPLIVETIRREREMGDFQATILKELREIRYQLALATHLVDTHQGAFSRTHLLWADIHLSDFPGRESASKARGTIQQALKLSDEEIAALAEQSKWKADGAPALKKYAMPILESRLASFTHLDPDLQASLMEIHQRLNLLNQIVDEYRMYFQLTFTHSEEVRKREQLAHNIAVALGAFRQQAVRVADLIRHLEGALQRS